MRAFSLKALRHRKHSKLFSFDIVDSDREVRDRELFKVNKARCNRYQHSSLIHCQKKLNENIKQKNLKNNTNDTADEL